MSLFLLFSMTQGYVYSLGEYVSATGEQTLFKSVHNRRNREKKCQQSCSATEGSWGTACPITLLCKESCCIIKMLNPRDFHMSASQVCSELSIIKAKETAAQLWKIKNSLKVKGLGRWAVSSRTAAGFLLANRKKTAQVELAVTRVGNTSSYRRSPALQVASYQAQKGEGACDGFSSTLKADKEGFWDYSKIIWFNCKIRWVILALSAAVSLVQGLSALLS